MSSWCTEKILSGVDRDICLAQLSSPYCCQLQKIRNSIAQDEELLAAGNRLMRCMSNCSPCPGTVCHHRTEIY
eukprot:COSAG01_NODE_72928_length_251_cov_1.677632_1_plen_72_part_10